MPAAAGSGSGSGASASAVEAPELQSAIRFSTNYSCALCVLKFENSREQREHMRSEWHIHNIRRRVEGLGSVDEEAFAEELAMKKSIGIKRATRRNLLSDDLPLESPPRRQLRRQQSTSSLSSDEGLSELGDPSTSSPEDMSDWLTTSSSDDEDIGTQQPSVGRRIDGDELRLPSGKILGNRDSQRPRQKRRAMSHSQAEETRANRPQQAQAQPRPHQQQLRLINALLNLTPSTRPQTQTLAKRNAAGLVGLSDAQKSALVKGERKTMGAEARKKRIYQDGVDKVGNSQKHYRIGGSRGGKKMGGLEKRLG